jgi:hypothetical protein
MQLQRFASSHESSVHGFDRLRFKKGFLQVGGSTAFDLNSGTLMFAVHQGLALQGAASEAPIFDFVVLMPDRRARVGNLGYRQNCPPEFPPGLWIMEQARRLLGIKNR